ncbi:polysaccharide deacetylase family protein [Cytophaga sp. FL35]|uniref:polysaccharide deacetylase family protein n=1 Tax=Cytophaga sp. FL35 TaxID=1904456 RepID=UPI001653DED6|nr:polysaccharide deacetylase family protein [Cytophaga sp. FL35]MBC6998091.1 polysaccharide deacetylase family protein [Cytophaga sp. FL35]
MHFKPIFFLLLFGYLTSFGQILKKEIPDKMVVLTFDDAPASHYSYVAPLLKEYGFGATFFVCEFPPNYKDTTLYMNWRQMKELHQMGFEIANHTRTHANVAKLSKDSFFEELSYIENTCDSLQINTPLNFAYPGYGLDDEVLNHLAEKNYRFARAGGKRTYNPLEDHPYLIPSWAPDATNEEEIMEAIKSAKNGHITVLTFHGVPDLEHPWVTVPEELFKKYMDFLKEKEYQVISLRKLETYIDVQEAHQKLKPDFSKRLKN